LDISIQNNQKDLTFNEKAVSLLVKETIVLEGQNCDEVSINFVSEEEICRLHEIYFNDPSPTDCISFPIDDQNEQYRLLGDVFVCPATAIKYADAHQLPAHDELALYIIHGLLHLMGYNDISDTDIKKMRAAEKRALDHLKALDISLSL